MFKQSLLNKEKEAVRFIRKAESLALRMSDKGFHVAFSGGKDSQVLLALMELSGCKYHAEMQVTSVDSPNLMRFVRANYPNVKLNLPKKNMRQLILQKKLLPTRQARYCCAILKEQAGAGSVTCVGVRAAESARRAKRKQIEVIGQKGVGFEIKNDCLVHEQSDGQLFDLDNDIKVYCIKGKDKVVISPIFKWSNNDVWDFIHGNNMPYCDLYDLGFHRIGCLFCPFASVKQNRIELEMFPLVAERIYIRAIHELMENGHYDNFDSPEQCFQWWISNENAQQWLAKQKSTSLFDDYIK